MKANINTEREKHKSNIFDVKDASGANNYICKGCPYTFNTDRPSCIFPLSSSDECFWKYYKRLLGRNKKYI